MSPGAWTLPAGRGSRRRWHGEIRKPLDRQMRIISIDHPNRGSRSMLAVQPHAHDPSHSTHHTAERPPAIETVEIDSIRLLKGQRSEEHTSELQSLMRISYAVFCLKKKKKSQQKTTQTKHK